MSVDFYPAKSQDKQKDTSKYSHSFSFILLPHTIKTETTPRRESGHRLYIQRSHTGRNRRTEMENTRKEDGFQEAGGEKGRRKRETGPRQTSEGKQKLMKQDVTIDGSLHPSKHGTLAGRTLPPPPRSSALFLSPSLKEKLQNLRLISLLCVGGSAVIILTLLQFGVGARLIGPLTFTYTRLYMSRSSELDLVTSPGAGCLRRLSTLGHKVAQIR